MRVRNFLIQECEFAIPRCAANLMVDYFLPEDGKDYFQLHIELFQFRHPKDDMFEMPIYSIQQRRVVLRWGLQTKGKFRIRFVPQGADSKLGSRITFDEFDQLSAFPFVFDGFPFYGCLFAPKYPGFALHPICRRLAKMLFHFAFWIGIRKLCNFEIPLFANDKIDKFLIACEFAFDLQ